jgi:P pilus assembly chaperone PapD
VGVPIFVRPPKADDSVNLQWQAQHLADGKLRLDATNSGTTHVQVTDFDVAFDSSSGLTRVSVVKYILPGNRVSWTVTPPASAASAAQIHIQGYSDHGDFQADATVAAAR